MTHRPARLLLAAPLTLALALAACAGDDSGASPGATTDTSPAASPFESPGVPLPDDSPSASPSESPAASPSGSPAGDAVEVVGVEYAYEEAPAEVSSGTTFAFRNDGSELHEMVVIRRNDDATASFEELLTMPPGEAEQQVSIIGSVFAEPGAAAPDTLTVEQAGDYAMVCFVPVGMVAIPSEDPNASPDPAATPVESFGPPHFTQGMLHTFTVTE